MPRKFDSEITIDSFDRWIFRGNEITHPSILRYFRENLKENSHGVYIENVFGELSENGYLSISGYPCHITNILEQDGEILFTSDDGRVTLESQWEIFQSPDGNVFALDPERPKILFRFDWNAATSLANYLEEEGDSVYFKTPLISREILVHSDPIEILLPTNFDFA